MPSSNCPLSKKKNLPGPCFFPSFQLPSYLLLFAAIKYMNRPWNLLVFIKRLDTKLRLCQRGCCLHRVYCSTLVFPCVAHICCPTRGSQGCTAYCCTALVWGALQLQWWSSTLLLTAPPARHVARVSDLIWAVARCDLRWRAFSFTIAMLPARGHTSSGWAECVQLMGMK